MSNEIHVYIAKEFSRYPSGRTAKDSRFSGEEFREKFLTTPLKQNKHVYVHLDGVLGYGSSFLDEAFGGLRREDKMSVENLKRLLHIVTQYPDLEWEAWSYIRGS